jgi:hypothetical protein
MRITSAAIPYTTSCMLPRLFQVYFTNSLGFLFAVYLHFEVSSNSSVLNTRRFRQANLQPLVRSAFLLQLCGFVSIYLPLTNL